jgi:glycine/D-amino acid oxidase-like deaminating enzyme
MSTTQKIIVVGAGVVGASIAWHLALKGASVSVVARKAGGEATPASFAWINASWGNPEFYFRFRHQSMAEWRKLATAIPELPLQWCGGLCFDLSPPELEAYAAQHGSWGYDIHKADREAAARIEPALLDPPENALHVPEEGAVEPATAANLLLADATRHGAAVLTDVEGIRLVTEHGRVVGLETASGTMRAELVLLAAGIGSVGLAQSVGVHLPIDAPPGLIVHSKPCRPILNGLVLAPQLHMRQTLEGRVVAGADFGGGDPGDNPQAAANQLFAKVKTMLRAGADLELDFFTVGHRPTPRDGFPIIGGADGVPGLYLAVMHSGVTLAPLVGRLVASEILGTEEPALSAYRLSRFATTPDRGTAKE